jgi:hypothetical protein
MVRKTLPLRFGAVSDARISSSARELGSQRTQPFGRFCPTQSTGLSAGILEAIRPMLRSLIGSMIQFTRSVGRD